MAVGVVVVVVVVDMLTCKLSQCLGIQGPNQSEPSGGYWKYKCVIIAQEHQFVLELDLSHSGIGSIIHESSDGLLCIY